MADILTDEYRQALVIRWIKNQKGKRKNESYPEVYCGGYVVGTISQIVCELLETELIEIADVYTTLQKETLPELKEILKLHALKLSGKKEDLIERIISNVPIDELDFLKNKYDVYVLTPKGDQFLKNHEWLFLSFENDIEISEYKNFEKKYPVDTPVNRIFFEILQEKFQTSYSERNFFKHQEFAYRIAKYLIQLGESDEATLYALISFFVASSGATQPLLPRHPALSLYDFELLAEIKDNIAPKHYEYIESHYITTIENPYFNLSQFKNQIKRIKTSSDVKTEFERLSKIADKILDKYFKELDKTEKMYN